MKTIYKTVFSTILGAMSFKNLEKKHCCKPLIFPIERKKFLVRVELKAKETRAAPVLAKFHDEIDYNLKIKHYRVFVDKDISKLLNILVWYNLGYRYKYTSCRPINKISEWFFGFHI